MPAKRRRWPLRTTISHAKIKGRTMQSPPNKRDKSARAMTWWRSRPSRPPRTDDSAKVMESTCPFHPKGKHSANDCYSLKDYVEKHSRGPVRDQDGPDKNPSPQAGGPAFPDPEHQLNMIYGGRMCTSPSGS